MVNSRDTDQIETFSDGVFAIVITLLVLDLKVPPRGGDSWQLLQMLARLWPHLLAVFLSFVTILIVWRNHHWVFTLVESVSSRFLYANWLLLLAITIIPFPTALVAAYLNQPAGNIAVAVYCSTYLLLNVGFNLP